MARRALQATEVRLRVPSSLASAVVVDGSGNLFVADGSRVRKVSAGTGTITTVVGTGSEGYSGDGGPAISAQLGWVTSLAFDGSGDLYLGDLQRIRRVSATTGIITTVAGSGDWGFAGDGGPATSAQLQLSYGVAVDGLGNIYIADTNNKRIRKVTAATGVITTVAGGGTAYPFGESATSAGISQPYGVAVDGSGNLYIPVARCIGEVVAATGIIERVAGTSGERQGGYSGDGGPATSAQLAYPEGLAVDVAGNLYIADSDNDVVRKVAAATGIITTVAGGGSGGFSGFGGPATSASISADGVTVDRSGNLYIGSDVYLFKVSAATGIITTVAGLGGEGCSGNGGPAASAVIDGATDVWLDRAGDVYFDDGAPRPVGAFARSQRLLASSQR